LTLQEQETLSSLIFIFSFIWSAGANLHDNPRDNSRLRFSQSIKGKFLKIFTGFPYEGDIYDYYVNFERREFRPWSDLLTEFKFNKDQPYFNILVPTPDTVKYKYMLQRITMHGKNVLITGETGVGKSVIIGDWVTNLDPDQFVFTSMNFSA